MGRQIPGFPLDREPANLASNHRSTTNMLSDLRQALTFFAFWFSSQYSKGLSYVTTMFASSSDVLKVRYGM